MTGSRLECRVHRHPLFVHGRQRGHWPGRDHQRRLRGDFYALLPSFGEAEIVHSAVPEDASILELGCGTGRILRPLAGLGHPVLGVDDSPAMLAHIPDLPTLCSTIEELRLDRTFGAVVLASTMINTDPGQRGKFLATCRRQLGPGGVAVFQQQAPSFMPGSPPALPPDR